MVTVWALCYASQVTPEHFLRCCRVHRPAEGATACKASSIWMPGPEVKVLVLSQLYFYPFLRLFRRFALTDFNFFMWIYRVTLTVFLLCKALFHKLSKKSQFLHNVVLLFLSDRCIWGLCHETTLPPIVKEEICYHLATAVVSLHNKRGKHLSCRNQNLSQSDTEHGCPLQR